MASSGRVVAQRMLRGLGIAPPGPTHCEHRRRAGPGREGRARRGGAEVCPPSLSSALSFPLSSSPLSHSLSLSLSRSLLSALSLCCSLSLSFFFSLFFFFLSYYFSLSLYFLSPLCLRVVSLLPAFEAVTATTRMYIFRRQHVVSLGQ